jgi:Arc/MetJ-type ribon-helix-helix transcriptional regulator
MGGKIRINITVDPETVRLADRLARHNKTSRSAILRDGVRALAENHQRASDEEARRRHRQEAVALMDRLAHEFGDWPAEEILRASRDRGRG